MSDELNITVTSAPRLGTMTPEQRKARYKELRRLNAGSRLEVTGDSSKHYFWAHKDDDPELIRLQALGYDFVREGEVEAIRLGKAKGKVQAYGLKDDGTYTIGDLILMYCAQEDYEFLILDTEARHEELQTAVKQEFLDQAEQSGVPTFVVNK